MTQGSSPPRTPETPEKFAVIGSNSFSGASFVARLLREPGVEVLGLSRSEELPEAYLPYKWSPPAKGASFRFVCADLNHDHVRLMEELDCFRPDYVVNFAAQAMVAESWLYPEQYFKTNVLSQVRLLEQLRLRDYLRKFVHISTPEVYGNCEGVIQEHTHYSPSTPYATSRAACDLFLMNLKNNYQFPVVFTRAANVFGPGQQLYRIIPRTIMAVRSGQKLQLHGGGHSVRSFIHIDDVTEGTLRAARHAQPGEIFHFSTDRFIAIKDLVAMICEKIGARFEDCVEIVGERPGKDAAYLLDNRKAQEALDWDAAVTLESGVQETIDWTARFADFLRDEPLSYAHKP
jgi:dTDP-glucose 4,6-dehydratase